MARATSDSAVLTIRVPAALEKRLAREARRRRLTRSEVARLVAARGVYTGQPRPAVVVQSNSFTAAHDSITLCLITSNAIETPMFHAIDNALRGWLSL